MKPTSIRSLILLFIALGATTITFYNCKSNNKDTADDELATAQQIFNFQASYKIPDSLDENANDTVLAAFAWQEFLALNWKSSYNDTTYIKGMPDTSWTYDSDTAKAPNTVVWETYAHRTELSPAHYPMRPFDSACRYSYGIPPTAGNGNASFGLLHNLDETSEIGSCSLFAFADSQNLYTDDYMVRYQAKTNRVEYDYIKNNFTSATALNNAVTKTKKVIDSIYNNLDYIITDSSQLVSLPNGSIEVKSAWRQLKPYEKSSQFLTRTVIVYAPNPDPNGVFQYSNKTYGLIGLHIIHKLKNHPSFVFATWEHIGVVQNDSMQYVLLTQDTSKPQTDSLGYMNPIRNPIATITNLATKYAHSLLPSTSVWRNYRLVGVQGSPKYDSATSPNFFLANYVVESDSLLARFHGSGFNSPFNGGNNVLLNRKLYSIGGCQGCHGGGAQHTGSDFSFIVNSPNSAPDPVVGPPPTTPTQTNKTTFAAQATKPKLLRLKEKYKH